jgi:hypothetical protein
MVECTRCGCRNDSESRFCAACGYSLLAPLLRRPTPAAGLSANPGLWNTPAGGFPQAAMPAPAPPQEAAWNLVQKRAVADAAGPARAMPDFTAPQPNHPNVMPPAAPVRTTTPPVGHTEPPQFALPVLMGFLVSFDGNELGRFWPMHQGRLIVGRSQSADGIDIAIDHGATSARHAQLIASALPSRVSVQDLGSSNGTFINDQRLAPGHAQLVAHGDRIRFGGFNVRVVLVV